MKILQKYNKQNAAPGIVNNSIAVIIYLKEVCTQIIVSNFTERTISSRKKSAVEELAAQYAHPVICFLSCWCLYFYSPSYRLTNSKLG